MQGYNPAYSTRLCGTPRAKRWAWSCEANLSSPSKLTCAPATPFEDSGRATRPAKEGIAIKFDPIGGSGSRNCSSWRLACSDVAEVI